MNPSHPPLRRRNPVAKALPRLRGGPHRSKPTRADLKRDLRRHLVEGRDPPERFGDNAPNRP
ncbi:MAG: hypothetical protein VBE63_24360 [Lamprobacter sp.]|uniref:hypothetical protein n=1 Tax=Lamprobacter sp. TaxID=3100796 RepID=UPI002B25D33A|nr:hypothetical protein [Lamprobacter sp.]MEA3643049.1 hypothetical protein [Lamprobacter sp.]